MGAGPRHPLSHLDGCGRRRCNGHVSKREDSSPAVPAKNKAWSSHFWCPRKRLAGLAWLSPMWEQRVPTSAVQCMEGDFCI